MNWAVLAFMSAIAVTISTLLEKKGLFKTHAATYATMITGVNALFSMLLLPFLDFSGMTKWSWAFLIFISIVNALAFLFVAKAMRHEEVSYISPMLNFNPAITAVLAFFLLKEELTMLQMGGIGLIILGAYGLHATHKHGILNVLKGFFSSRAQHFIWLAMLLYGFGAIGNKYLLNIGMAPLTLLGTMLIVQMITLYGILAVRYSGRRDLAECWRNAGISVVVAGFFLFLSRLALTFAFSIGFVALAIGVKRLSALFIALIGGEMFHEHNLIKRLAAGAVMIIGVLLLV